MVLLPQFSIRSIPQNMQPEPGLGPYIHHSAGVRSRGEVRQVVLPKSVGLSVVQLLDCSSLTRNVIIGFVAKYLATNGDLLPVSGVGAKCSRSRKRSDRYATTESC